MTRTMKNRAIVSSQNQQNLLNSEQNTPTQHDLASLQEEVVRLQKRIVELEQAESHRSDEQTFLLQQAVERLMLELHRREQVEQTLLSRDAILQAIGFVSDLFMRSVGDPRTVFPLLLERLGKATNVNRVVIFENTQDEAHQITTHMSYEWIAAGTEPFLSLPDFQHISYKQIGLARVQYLLEQGEPVYGSIDEFPADEQVYLQQYGVKTLLIIPIFTDLDWVGFIAFAEDTQEHPWSVGEVDALRIAAGMIGALMQRNIIQKALDMSEAEHRKLYRAVDQSPISIIVTDTEGVIEYVNPRFTQVSGYTFDEAVGQHTRFLKTGLTPPETYQELWQTITVGKKWQGEMHNRKKDGAYFWVSASISPIFNGHGDITHFVAMNEDITQRKQTEQEMRESEERFRLVADFTFAWEYWIGTDGSYLYISPSCERITGYRPEEFMTDQRLIERIIHPDDKQRMCSHFYNQATEEDVCSTTFRIITRDGREEWIGHVCQPVFSFDGTWLGRRASNREITLQVRAEEALRASEKRFRLLAENAQDIIYRYRLVPTYEWEYVSPSVSMITGYSPQEFYADPWLHRKIMHPDCQILTASIDALLMNQNESLYLHILCKDGTDVWLEVKQWHIFDETGQKLAIEGIMRDITERRKTELELLQQQKALSMLHERERVARELHDSIGQILGYVNTQTQAIREFLVNDNTEQATTALSHLIRVAQEAHTDVRDFILGVHVSRSIQSQDVFMEQGFCNALQQYVESLHRLYNLKVALHIPTEITDDMFTPVVQVQLLRMIQEALTNVRKHAEVQQAEVTFALLDDHIEVKIADQGKGFDTVVLKESAVTSLNKGYGLQSMRGRAEEIRSSVQITSKLGAGTQVVILIPMPKQQRQPFINMHVLLVDDNQLFTHGLQTLLSAYGFTVVGTAVHGKDALTLVRKTQPDVVLMDIEMPVCNGLEATQRIKAEFPDVQVVMLTASDEDKNLFEAIKSGASGYLLKSMNAEELCSMLLEVVEGEVPLSPGLAARILHEFVQQINMESNNQQEHHHHLLAYEIDILTCISQGFTYRETGEHLGYSERSIKRYMGDIMQRLQLKNRAEVIEYVRRTGIS